jgi:predicted DNA-binding protein
MGNETIEVTVYLPEELNDPVDWLEHKTKKSKNSIFLEAINRYLEKEMKKYPEYPDYKGERP